MPRLQSQENSRAGKRLLCLRNHYPQKTDARCKAGAGNIIGKFLFCLFGKQTLDELKQLLDQLEGTGEELLDVIVAVDTVNNVTAVLVV